MSDYIKSVACSTGATLLAGWARSSTTGAGLWYLIMSFCLLAMAVLYAAQGILDAADQAATRKRKLHKAPQRTVRSTNNRKAG